MAPILEYFATLVHLLGMVLFVGGHLWFGWFTAFTESRQDHEGARFLAAQLPIMANLFGLGVLLLLGSGLLRLFVWGEPGLIFLPDPYGWVMLSKLLLYMIIVINGLIIERRYLPHVLREMPGAMGEARTFRLTPAWEQVKLRARLNLVLTLVVVALGEALRYSKV